MINIALADDHKILRDGLKQIIEESRSGIEISGEASDYESAIKLLRENDDIDVLVLDISMPGPSGLDVIKKINKDKIDVKVLVLSMYSEEEYALRVLAAGAMGYIEKKCAAEELVDAVKRVHKGFKHISKSIRDKMLIDSPVPEPGSVQELLSDREFEVMLGIAAAKAVSEIARELNLSVKTISTYRKRIIQKTGLKNNAEIMKYAIKNNLT